MAASPPAGLRVCEVRHLPHTTSTCAAPSERQRVRLISKRKVSLRAQWFGSVESNAFRLGVLRARRPGPSIPRAHRDFAKIFPSEKHGKRARIHTQELAASLFLSSRSIVVAGCLLAVRCLGGRNLSTRQQSMRHRRVNHSLNASTRSTIAAMIAKVLYKRS